MNSDKSKLALLILTLCIGLCTSLAQGDPPAQVEARQIAAQAVANQQARVAGFGDDLRNAATRLLDVGLPEEALVTVQLVINTPESELDPAIGYVIEADIYEAKQMRVFARDSLSQSIAQFNQSSALRKLLPSVYARVFARLANTHLLTGDPDTALAMLDNLLAATPDTLTQGLRESTLYNRITYARLSSTPTRVIDSIDSLLQFNPGYGQTDGTNIALRLERALAIDNRAWGASLIAELEAMWADPAIRLQPQILDVANVLINAYLNQDSCENALDVASQSLVLLDSSRTGWIARNQPPFDPEWMDSETIELIGVLHSGAVCQRPWLTAWAIQRMFDSGHWSDQDALTREFVEFASRITALDGSTPPNGQGVFPDSNGLFFPESATVLASSFVDDSSVPVRINGGGPLRFVSSPNWTTGFDIYAGSDDGSSWTLISAFKIRAPFDSLVNGNGQFLGISRAQGVQVRPGVYAIVPRSTVKWSVDVGVTTSNCPSVVWQQPPFTSLVAPNGAYLFRVAPDCDSNSTNDYLQISLGLSSDPPVTLDLNGNGVLDSCELADPCRVDINGDHIVSVSDIFDFLNFWFAVDSHADFDIDGQITTQDIFVFLNAWFSFGGPC